MLCAPALWRLAGMVATIGTHAIGEFAKSWWESIRRGGLAFGTGPGRDVVVSEERCQVVSVWKRGSRSWRR